MLSDIFKLIKDTGSVLMDFYNNKIKLNISYKLDKSLITNADHIANEKICKKLKFLFPNIPILSEEYLPDWNNYRFWDKYWLIDPLDGTKEFVNRQKEFSINIALIEYGIPVLGIIYIPFFNTLYYADQKNSWKEKENKKTRICIKDNDLPVIALSRSHPDFKIHKYLSVIGNYEIINIGSSLKFCLVAEGKVQLYPRLGVTNIWDTAAGEIIVKSAGGVVIGLNNQSLNYYPRSIFSNTGFYVGTQRLINLIGNI